MSGKMAAIVGWLLDERFTDPTMSELVVTSDGFVLAQLCIPHDHPLARRKRSSGRLVW